MDSHFKTCCAKDCEDFRYSTSSYCRYHSQVQYKKDLDFSTLSKEEYDNKIACDICNVFFANHKEKHLDHEHGGDKIRGILCHKCNTALGLFQDNPWILHKAADYLTND